MTECWRDIKGWEGVYCVSNLGRIMSCDKKVKARGKGYRVIKGTVLRPTRTRTGYLYVNLCDKNQSSRVYVHRIVATVFIPNPNNFSEINHKDENKQNNSVFINTDGSVDLEKSNLEWCTHVYNMNYGTAKYRRGLKMRNNTINSKPVIQLSMEGDFINEYPSASEATRQIGNTNSNSSSILGVCRGENYSAFGYLWKFKKDYLE